MPLLKQLQIANGGMDADTERGKSDKCETYARTHSAPQSNSEAVYLLNNLPQPHSVVLLYLLGCIYGSYLVDPASSHMLVSKIKPCMSKYKQLYSETANGSLYQL